MSGRGHGGKRTKGRSDVSGSAKKKKTTTRRQKWKESRTRMEFWLTGEDKAKFEEMKSEQNINSNIDGFTYLLNMNTSCNEVFNSTIATYSPKRLSYRPPGYKARCLLAAIDYQSNKDRQVATTQEGEVRLQRRWIKRSKRWDACPVKENKDYSFISVLLEKAMSRRLQHPELMRQKVVLEESDPRRLSDVLATEKPGPTKDIYDKKQTRM